MTKQISTLLAAMIAYDRGDARRIQHLVKVHDFATAIGVLEGMPEDELFILESAAILHDIGIHVSEQKYNSSSGKYQELEGPGEADKVLRELGGYTEAQIERIKFLIGHHHTYNDIQGLDYQILVEADFLVNLYEDNVPMSSLESVKEKIFKTATGTKFLEDMFATE